MFRTREVLGLSLKPATGYPDYFSSVPPGKCRDSALNYVTTGFLHILSN
jgi:hypothetical protein